MILKLFIILVAVFVVQAQDTNLESQCEPQGVKISLGDRLDKSINKNSKLKKKQTPHDYTITYFSRRNCPNNYVKVFTSNKSEIKLTPIITYFKQEADLSSSHNQKRNQTFEMYIYEFQLSLNSKDFKPDSYIYYSCVYSNDEGSSFEEKSMFNFFNPDYSKLSSREFKILWVADIDVNKSKKFGNRQFGYENMQRINQYIKKNRKKYVSIIGGGDYSYDLVDDSGERGINFLKKGEFLFSSIPFVTVAGNHEEWYDYSYFQAFFRNPNHSKTKSEYYTMEFGNLLMIGMNTNRLIKGQKNKLVGLEQPYFNNLLNWLDHTLEWANQKYKWVVVYSHQNIHCFEDRPNGYCTQNASILKPLEDVMMKHKVDIYLAAHVHAYERIHPIYQGKLQFQETDKCQKKGCSLYESPKAPVYVVDGTAGTNHFFLSDDGYPGHPEFTVASDRHLGFSTITVKNDTHLLFQHIQSDNFKVFDQFYIYKPENEERTVFNQQSQPESTNDNEYVTNSTASNTIYIIFIFLIFGLIFFILFLLYRKSRDPTKDENNINRMNSYNTNNQYNQQYGISNNRPVYDQDSHSDSL